MAETGTNDRVKEITDKLEAGLKALFEGDNYKNYLNTMAKFHNYSFNNTMLIALQKPDATLVAGFDNWKKKFGRSVNSGEHGIKIFAPAPITKEIERQKKDDETGEPLFDVFGEPITEKVEIKIPRYKVVSVFDVSQTSGRPLPEIAVNELTGSVEDYEQFFAALKEISPVPIQFKDIAGDTTKGYYSFDEKAITIRSGMPEVQNIKTAIHEIAHALLHDKTIRTAEGEIPLDSSTKEVQAESVAYTVCQHFGIETSDYSFGYLASWGSGMDTPELKASLEIIRSTAKDLINKIAERMPEREIKAEISADTPANEQPEQRNSNIIGNTEYKEIENKTYTKLTHEQAAEVAKRLDNAGVHFSGRIEKKSTTITVSEADKSLLDYIIGEIKEREAAAEAKEAAQEETTEEKPKKTSHVIGNTDYKSIEDKKYIKFPNEKGAEIAKQLEAQGVSFSGYVGKKQTTLTVSGDANLSIVEALSKQYDMEKAANRLTGKNAHITKSEIELANSVNLPRFLMSQGIELKRVGKEYTMPDHDSIRIYDNQAGEKGKWYRFSEGKGGDNISFVQEFFEKTFREAVEMLKGGQELAAPDFQRTEKAKESRDIHIEENSDKRRAFAYLTKTRGLDRDIVSDLIKEGKLTQEAKTGNAVFLIKDENGKTVGAEKVGTSPTSRFKGIESGSNSEYGFEVVVGKGENAFFFESAIDMLSFMQIHKGELDNERLISMAGVKPNTVEAVMKRNNIPPEKVFLCADNDRAGNDFVKGLQEKYPNMKRLAADNGFKDWNDQLRNIPIAEKEMKADKAAKDETSKSATVIEKLDWSKFSEQEYSEILEAVALHYIEDGKDGYTIPIKSDREALKDYTVEINIKALGDKWAVDYDLWSEKDENYIDCGGGFYEEDLPDYDTFRKTVEASIGTEIGKIELAAEQEKTSEMGEHFKTPVICHNFKTAQSMGADAVMEWRENKHENDACNKAIRNAIKEASVSVKYGVDFDAKKAAEQVLKEFPAERVAHLIAHQVIPDQNRLENPQFIDGRFSNSVRNWAADVILKHDNYCFENFDYCNFAYDTHPVLADSFAKAFILAERELIIESNQPKLEAELFKGADKFNDHESSRLLGIYQLKSGDENHYRSFVSADVLKNITKEVPDINNYQLIAVYPVRDNESIDETLNRFYGEMNMEKPKDFLGHTPSVSDVIVINDNGSLSAHYIDSIGFMELSDFGRVHNPEVGNIFNQPEQQEAPLPTVAELEARAANGEQISITELSKAIQKEKEQPVTENSPLANEPEKPVPASGKVIGNTPSKDIPNKVFIRLDPEKAEKVAAELEKNGVKFGGKVFNDKATLTISKSDEGIYKQVASEIENASVLKDTPAPVQNKESVKSAPENAKTSIRSFVEKSKGRKKEEKNNTNAQEQPKKTVKGKKKDEQSH